MHFWHQLKILIWKNFKLRRNKKILTICEILVPLLFFLILVWARTQELREPKHECHYASKYLPSSGGFRFMKSLICEWNNTCFDRYPEGSDQNSNNSALTFLPKKVQSLIFKEIKFYELPRLYLLSSDINKIFDLIKKDNLTFQGSIDMKKIFLNESAIYETWEAYGLQDLFLKISKSELRLDNLNSFQVLLRPYDFFCHDKYLLLFDVDVIVSEQYVEMCLSDDNSLDNLLSMTFSGINYTSLIYEILDNIKIGEDTLHASSWKLGLDVLERVLSSISEDGTLDSIFNANTKVNSMSDIFSRIGELFCGSKIRNIFSEVKDESLRAERILSSEANFSVIDEEEFSYSNGSICNQIFDLVTSTPAAYFAWNKIKPLISGKIIYTPSSPASDKIIERIKYSITSVENELYSFAGILKLITPIDGNDTFVLIKYFNAISVAQNLTSGRIELTKNLLKSYVSILPLVKLTDKFVTYLQCLPDDRFIPSETEEDLVHLGMKLVEHNQLFAGIVFMNVDNNETKLPKHVSYKLRFNSDMIDSTSFIMDNLNRPGSRRRPFIDMKYLTSGFAYLQDIIDHSIIEIQSGKNNSIGIALQQIPYPCYTSDRFIRAIARALPMFVNFSWIFTASMIIKSIVYEKEKKLTSFMKTMGLQNSVIWSGWFISNFIIMIITMSLLTLILHFGSVLFESDPLIIWLFLFMFTVATIAECFVISLLFSKANIAAAAGGILYFILYLPYPLLTFGDRQPSEISKKLASLIPNVAFGFGCSYLSMYEDVGIGVKWTNIDTSPRLNDDWSLQGVILILFLDTIIYLVIVWLVDFEFGKNLRYIFQRTISKKVSQVFLSKSDDDVTAGVSLVNLTKRFTKKTAVDNISYHFQDSCITSLLGHNGAGKTTTIGMMCGMISPTSGTVLCYGQDIRKNLVTVQQELGFCPQHNILFDGLTVSEHLKFYYLIKKPNTINLKEIIEKNVQELNLPGNKLAQHLSGGMMRKLSIAIAFIAENRTVILDEPTAGVDPQSRRSIWDLILTNKSNRTIIITTHFMDEADILSDEIVLMSEGKIVASGTFLSLKNQFAKGFYLRITKKEISNVEMTTTSSTHSLDLTDESQTPTKESVDITTFLQERISGVRLLENVGLESLYLIPLTITDVEDALTNFLSDLEGNMEYLHIDHYVITDTTLEDIFFLATTGSHHETDSEMLHSIRTNGIEDIESSPNVPLTEPEDFLPFTLSNKVGKPKGSLQFKACLEKRFHHWRRNKKGFIVEIILPVVFVILSLLVTLFTNAPLSEPPLELTPWLYTFDYMFIHNNNSDVMKELLPSFFEAPGLGTLCLQSNTDSQRCKSRSFNSSKLDMMNVDSDRLMCSCRTESQICDTNEMESLPLSPTYTGDPIVLLNGTGLSHWLVKRRQLFEHKLYGGYQFVQSGPVKFVIPGLINWNDGEKKIVKVWYNNKGWASSVSFTNAMNNLLLRNEMKGVSDDWASYGITCFNHPMNRTLPQMERLVKIQASLALFVAVNVVFALSFIPAGFVLYLIEENSSKSKHLQMISGLHPLLYWGSQFVWDLINYTIACFLCILVFLAFNNKAYVGENSFPGFLLLMLLYGWAIIPAMYPASFLFNVPSFAFVVLSSVNFMIGFITTFSTFMLEILDDETLNNLAEVLKDVFIIFPHFCLGRGLMNLAIVEFRTSSLKIIGIDVEVSPFEWDILGQYLLSLAITGLLFIILVPLIEYWRFCSWPFNSKLPQKEAHLEDDDVADERNFVDSNENILKVIGLSKAYHRSKNWSVYNLTFGVKSGECFGLLGTNGAGKTTTFKMLTGDLKPTFGVIKLLDFNLKSRSDRMYTKVGYCPQFDALDNLLTVSEHLHLYGKIRGLEGELLERVVIYTIKELQLANFNDKTAGVLSGGNKRKLSTAIAVLGDPAVVYLDEPTTGMDPKAKRFLWQYIVRLRELGKAIVLTSHSMEECEALCSKIGIMKEGIFLCLGSAQHLKFKFHPGYILSVKTSANNISDLTDFIADKIEGMSVREMVGGHAKYNIPLDNASVIFETLVYAQKEYSLESYSIHQASLEEVFIQLVTRD